MKSCQIIIIIEFGNYVNNSKAQSWPEAKPFIPEIFDPFRRSLEISNHSDIPGADKC